MLNKLHAIYPKLYGHDYCEKEMDERYESLISNHMKIFGKDNPMLFSASGRTEIAGNHTDHNQGLVIGGTINLDTIAAVSYRDDNKVYLSSEGFPLVEIDISDCNVVENEKNTTNALIRGIAAAFKERGLKIGGWEANTTTKVLKGSGLSSSAAIEVLSAEIFNSLYNNDALDPVELAKIGQYAENVYFGKPSGLLDQICCAQGGIACIDFKDKSNPIVTPLSIDFDSYGYAMIITDTKGSHANLTPEYGAVPSEMKDIAMYFGKKNLREVSFEDFENNILKIRNTIKNDRAILRAYHYFKENERVCAMREALLNKDIQTFMKLVKESGNSSFRFLQNVYPSSDPASQSLSIAIAISENILKDEGAVRVHGGGFAGTIQAYVPKHLLPEYINAMEAIFGEGCTLKISIRKEPVLRIV